MEAERDGRGHRRLSNQPALSFSRMGNVCDEEKRTVAGISNYSMGINHLGSFIGSVSKYYFYLYYYTLLLS